MDVEIIPYHMFISNQQFTGIMKSSYVKDFHTLKLKLDFFKIMTNDKTLLEMVAKSCLQDNTTVNPLKLVSNELVYSKIMNVDEAESFRNYLYFINSRSFLDDQKNNTLWNIKLQFPGDIHYFVVTLSTNQVLRLYNYVNTYYSQHQMLNLFAKTYLCSTGSNNEPIEEKKVTEYVNSNQVIIDNIEIPKNEPEVSLKEKNEFDDIFELCLSSTIKASLIHYTMTYFRFLEWDTCKIVKNENDQVMVTCPVLLPGKMGMDEDYFHSVIVTSNLHLNSTTFIIRKILSLLIQNSEIYSRKPINIIMITYLLFLYMMRYNYDTNRDSFRRNFFKYICSPKAQQFLISILIKSTFSEFINKINFNFLKNSEFNSKNDSSELEELYKSFKHLIPVSQEEFAEKVFFKLQDQKKLDPIDFKISSKKIINIKDYLIDKNGTSSSNISTKLFDFEHSLNPEKLSGEINLLMYEQFNGDKTISNTYRCLLNYVKNPTSLLLIKDKDIPKEVLNLFDLISKNILNTNLLTKETNSTFYFYNLLLEKLPNARLFKHSTLLYIVYQIIIPYCYDLYGTTHYQDCFI